MKRTFLQTLLLFVLMLACVFRVSATDGALHWYCMRNKANRQPPLPAEFSFIEEYNGIYIDHAHHDAHTERVVYLTFDAGYENGNVARILDVLQEAQVKGAFFILKHLISANGELVKRMVSEGHLVCNHTAHHPNLSHASQERIQAELGELEEAYQSLIGTEMPRFFRPPEGSFSREMLSCVSGLGYTTVFWSFAYADWDNNAQPSPQKALQCIMGNMHNGAIILLHPTSTTNVQVLPQVIAELKAQGYRFGSLEELCAGS